MTTTEYTQSTHSATVAVTNHSKSFNNPVQTARRKITREVSAMWDEIARAAGFEPAERRAAFAVSTRLYERAGQDCETPRGVSLAAIGSALTSRSDDETARASTARNRLGQLFNHAIPRCGYQILTRYKAEEESGKPHEYADHITPVAALFSEELAKQTDAILSNKRLDRKAKAEQIAVARAQLVAEAVTWLPKCEVELVTPEGQTYTYVSAPEAKAYCERKPEYKARPYQYRDPEIEKPKPYLSDDFDRLKKRAVSQAVDAILNAIGERNGKDTARIFWQKELLPAIEHAGEKWINYCRVEDDGDAEVAERKEERLEELIHVSEFVGGGGLSSLDAIPEKNLSDLAERPDGADVLPAAETPSAPPIGSENFDTSLEAALSYIRDGWAVIPCRDKVPLIKGKGKPGDGYQAANRDKGKVADYFNRQFPNAGVAIRLDNALLGDCILIDCDVKNGALGLESFDELDATFSLPSTLSAITPSGGRHHIFKLPADLPADYLGSWTGILDGIDLKVGNKGLCHVEPTATKNGVYRWIDPCAEIAELPRKVCDYFHNIHEQQQRKPTTSPMGEVVEAQPFDPDEDQSKYVKDVDKGDRHPRLRSIACALAARGANENQIVDVLKFHDSQFKKVGPTSDFKFMAHVAQGAVSKYRQGAAQ